MAQEHVKVRNLNRFPLEFKLDGVYCRWEPKGTSGDTIGLPRATVQGEQFKQVRRYLAVIGE